MYFNHTYNRNSNHYLTPGGFDQLKRMLNSLDRQQQELGQELKEVREPGNDIDNTSYTESRAQAVGITSHMHNIRHILRNATIIRRPQRKDVIELGNMIELQSGDDIRHYMLVGSLEADPSEHKLSDQSPVGKQLTGKRIGDEVEIGNGHKRTFRITAIR